MVHREADEIIGEGKGNITSFWPLAFWTLLVEKTWELLKSDFAESDYPLYGYRQD